MEHIKPEEKTALNNCHSVKQMLTFLNERFDLNIIPPVFSKILIVNGLCTAINILKPVRKSKIDIKNIEI